MITKKIIDKERIRRIDGGFAFIPHRFFTGGFVSDLTPNQLVLYFFLVLAADRFGLSFYSYDKICTILEMSLAVENAPGRIAALLSSLPPASLPVPVFHQKAERPAPILRSSTQHLRKSPQKGRCQRW